MSRSGSFGAIPAGAARRRRRLSSVMLRFALARSRVGVGIYLSGGHYETASLRLVCMARGQRIRAAQTSRSVSREALQNTGPYDFRQPQFVDTRNTPGYTWWFLPDVFATQPNAFHGVRLYDRMQTRLGCVQSECSRSA